MRTFGLVAAAGMLALLAACGTTHHAPTKGPADAAFLSTANSSCQAAMTNSAANPFPYPGFVATDPPVSELPGVGSYFDSLHFNHDELGFVKSFGSPRQGLDSWREFVALVGQQQDIVAKQISYAKASDKTGFGGSAACVQLFG